MSQPSSTFLYGANVHANGIRQHYLRYGGADGARAERDALILIPGITSPAVTWGFVAERLGRRYDTYVLDVRGRGLSSADPGLDYSLDAQAADVLALAQALGLQRYALMGHSMGSLFGCSYLKRYEDDLSGLILSGMPAFAKETAMGRTLTATLRAREICSAS